MNYEFTDGEWRIGAYLKFCVVIFIRNINKEGYEVRGV